MLKFMYNGIKLEDKFYKACYSDEGVEDAITIYVTKYSNFPMVEGLQQTTDLITGLRVIRVVPNNKFYKEVLEAYNKQQTHNTKTVSNLYANFKC